MVVTFRNHIEVTRAMSLFEIVCLVDPFKKYCWDLFHYLSLRALDRDLLYYILAIWPHTVATCSLYLILLNLGARDIVDIDLVKISILTS